MIKLSKTLWSNYLLTLNEEIFYDLYYAYLGPIPSPHHKPELIKQMSSLLSRPDIRENIKNSLSRSDLEILIPLKNNGSMPRDGIQSEPKIKNLLDRLWLIEIEKELFINGELSDLIPEANISKTSYEYPLGLWSPGFIFVLFASVEKLMDGIKKDGKLSKKSIAELTELYSGLKDQCDFLVLDEGFFGHLIRAFVHLGIFRFFDSGFEISKSRIDELFALDYIEIAYIIIAASVSPPHQVANLYSHLPNFQSSSQLAHRARALRDFLSAIPPKGEIHELYQIRLAFPSEFQAFLSWAIETSLPGFGILELVGTKYKLFPPIPQPGSGKPSYSGTAILIPEDFDFSSYKDLSKLVQVEKMGRVNLCQFSPEKIRNLPRSLVSMDLVQEIKNMITPEPPQALLTQIEWWLTESHSVNVKPGVLLELSGHKGRDIEDIISGMPLCHKISEGSYFIENGQYDLLYDLELKGLIDLKHLSLPDQRTTGTETELPPIRRLAKPSIFEGLPTIPQIEPQNGALVSRLFSLIENIPFTEIQKSDMRHLISQNVIIHESQLAYPPKPLDRGQAAGFDFGSKLRAITASVISKNEVLIVTFLEDTEMRKLEIYPQKIDGKGPEALLLGHLKNEHKLISLPIRKISNIYRKRESIHF